MSTSGILVLGADECYALPYHRWIAWVGPGTCDTCGAHDGVFWRFTTPHWMLTVCEEHADSYWKPGMDVELWRSENERGHPDDGPGECF
jgi:hypothetical protein